MDEFEKVEKLRQRANVSYEEAKEALNASNGDLLDAMIYLEKQGKTTGTAGTAERVQGTVERCVPVCTDSKEERKKKAKADGEKFKSFCKNAWRKGNDNVFIMRRKDENVIKIPVWAFILILLFTFHVVLPLMLISLFFECRYCFEGKDDLNKVNDVMNQAGDAAEKIKADYFTNNTSKE